MIRRVTPTVVLAVVALLSAVSSAQADPLPLPVSIPPQLRALLRERTQSSPARSNFESRFAMKASHGYEMAVIGRGQVVQVEIGKPSSFQQKVPFFEAPVGTRQAFTTYVARGTVTPRRITASFGKFGKVDVRFKPAGPSIETQARHRCRGADHFTIQRGMFVGNVRFSGEGNYVSAHSHHAQGRVRTPLHLFCLPPRVHTQDRSLQRAVHKIDLGFHSSLSADARHGVNSTELFSFGIRKRQLTAAITEASLGSLAEIHFGLVVSNPKILTVNNALTSATLTPPAPFHGKGTYSATPDGTKTWTGPLTVAFPGAPRWSLTGEQFKVGVNTSF